MLSEYVTILLSKLESIQARESLKSEEKLNIWAYPVIERDEDEKTIEERNKVVTKLLMIYYILTKRLKKPSLQKLRGRKFL